MSARSEWEEIDRYYDPDSYIDPDREKQAAERARLPESQVKRNLENVRATKALLEKGSSR